jgi:RNA binding domain
MSTSGDDDLPDTSNIFYMTHFPSDWQTRNILSLFKLAAPVSIKWLGDIECLVVVRDKAKVPIVKVIMDLGPSDTNCFKLRTWEEYSEICRTGSDGVGGVANGVSGAKMGKMGGSESNSRKRTHSDAEDVTDSDGPARKKQQCVIS